MQNILNSLLKEKILTEQQVDFALEELTEESFEKVNGAGFSGTGAAGTGSGPGSSSSGSN